MNSSVFNSNRFNSDAVGSGFLTDNTPSQFFNKETYKNYHPYLYSLQKINWSVFGTLTWAAASRRRETPDAETLRTVDFNQLLFKACGRLKTRRKHLWFYHCMEWGKAGECHFHFLICNHRVDAISNKVLAQTIQDIWTDEFNSFGSKRHGAGTAKVVPYDEAKEFPAVRYCLKREWDEQGKERERFDKPSKELLNFLVKEANQENPRPLIAARQQQPPQKSPECETL